MLMFKGDVKDVGKVWKLVKNMLSLGPQTATDSAATTDGPQKKSKFVDATSSEAEGIISSEKLSDQHIKFA